MARMTIARKIDATPEATWQVIRDFGNVANYSSGLSGSRQTTDGDVGVGAERVCDFKQPMMGKSQIQERVTEFSDDERLIAVDILGGMGPFKTMNGRFRVEPEGDDATMLYFDQVAEGGLMATLMGPLASMKFKKELTGFMADVGAYVENQANVVVEA